ncbi:MAG: hypothetical protein SLAVMIC_01016 [uncultured marine phage]|uniref:Uncharacterized protein n=1 Tax=uncultured marine phage TaxID=707152 RepID=A0A8D9FRK5_9VIRU|nr:MAG: hypothetical protein SLAVMIC_01016 [uncultured marine phage]
MAEIEKRLLTVKENKPNSDRFVHNPDTDIVKVQYRRKNKNFFEKLFNITPRWKDVKSYHYIGGTIFGASSRSWTEELTVRRWRGKEMMKMMHSTDRIPRFNSSGNLYHIHG